MITCTWLLALLVLEIFLRWLASPELHNEGGASLVHSLKLGFRGQDLQTKELVAVVSARDPEALNIKKKYRPPCLFEQQRPPRLSVRGPIKQRGGRDSARHRAKRVPPHEVFIVAS